MRQVTMRHVAGFAAALLAALGAARANAAGLLAPTDETLPPLRVSKHLVDAVVHDRVALTTVTQEFVNETSRRLEATYVFPLPENADLTDFQMSFNGKMAQGKVLPAPEAARIYERIVRQSRDPGLIEFIGRRLLQMRVFPIEPNSTTTIQVRYQQICTPVSGMRAYHYPLRTCKTAGQSYGTVRFSVDLETAAPLKSIWSPTHAVEIVRDRNERTARVAYEASRGSLEDDFLLLFDTDDSDLGLSVVAFKPESDADGHFVLMLTPKQLWPEEEVQPQDVVFVVDTSGSMAGEKIDQARAAVSFCIDRLDEKDRFSVVRFSTGFDVLYESLQPATAERRAEGREWVRKFPAAGGTNILDTLRHVMGMRAAAEGDSARPFVVVFLTDGQGNRTADEIMSALHPSEGRAVAVRVFPFGVGHDVNTMLLDRLADAYAGRTRYVQPGENLELVLGDFFSIISRPVLTELTLTLPEIGATERFPAVLGDLYHGQQIILAGRFSKPATGKVTLGAMRGGKQVGYTWPDVRFDHTDSAGYVPAVWAGRKIAYLVDQIRAHGESPEMVDEILTLSVTYGIQTPYTSWLVNPEGEPRPVRTTILGGGGGFGGGGGTGAPGMAPRRPPGARSVAPADQERRLRSAGGGSIFGDPGEAPESLDAPTYGDEYDEIDLLLAEEAVVKETGAAANLIARKNAELRETRSRDEDRLDLRILPYVKLGDRWYNRIGRFLVDESVGEKTKLTIVRFASDAYFEIARQRPKLRAALAASPTVVVIVAPDQAVLVSDRTGTAEFSDEMRQELGLEPR